jgi:hypothetical protein
MWSIPLKMNGFPGLAPAFGLGMRVAARSIGYERDPW